MPNLSIKNVPAEVVDQLRKNAAAHHRSLQGELMALVCAAAQAPTPVDPAQTSAAPAHTQERESGWKTVDQIWRSRGDRAVVQAPRAVDIIRQERDER